MTVKELKDFLEQVDENMEVEFYSLSFGYCIPITGTDCNDEHVLLEGYTND